MGSGSGTVETEHAMSPSLNHAFEFVSNRWYVSDMKGHKGWLRKLRSTA